MGNKEICYMGTLFPYSLLTARKAQALQLNNGLFA